MADALLPANATPYEIAQSLTSAARRPLPADLIRSVWNPDTCPPELLAHLANALSVDVWDETWDVEKKRHVIRRAIPVQRIKGTLAAIREYAGYRGAEIVDVYRPPSRFFAGALTPPSEYRAWSGSTPRPSARRRGR
jgi:phage tail P2-like protein